MSPNAWQAITISLLLVLFLAGAEQPIEHPGHFMKTPCQFFFVHPTLTKGGGKEQWEVLNVNQIARIYDLLDDNGNRQSTVVIFANGRAVAYSETLDDFVSAWKRCRTEKAEMEKH